MSETANTLIKSALRQIGVIATGETPTAAEMQDGLEAMRFMIRHWSAKNIMIPYMTNEAITTTGAESYTWGTGGVINTARPEFIVGAYVSGERTLKVVDQAKYRQLRVSGDGGELEYIWYSPEYPLGKLYIWPAIAETIYVDSLKALSDPTAITTSIVFLPEYDEAIKYNLAVRLAPEYGKSASPEVVALALSGLQSIENRNFAAQMSSVDVDVIKISHGSYNIDSD
jgi:hypothetical protein